MKQIGLVGGISWHATSKYYGIINQAVNDYFGNNTNPPLMIYNVNQSQMHQLQRQGDWESIGEMILKGAESLIDGGSELIVICSNTTHKVVPLIKDRINKPLLHIGDSTAQKIKSNGFDKVGFIGTKFGMEDPFLIDRIKSHNINILVPDNTSSILELHRIIHEELTYNKVATESKGFVLQVIRRMQDQGAQGIILGCTEFSLMFEELELELPIFDTVEIHARDVVREILEGILQDR